MGPKARIMRELASLWNAEAPEGEIRLEFQKLWPQKYKVVFSWEFHRACVCYSPTVYKWAKSYEKSISKAEISHVVLLYCEDMISIV